ncbi:MAG: hypothetical protein AAFX99_17485 [Myxococcota bacterium]
MTFGRHLLNLGYITPNDLFEALNLQQRETPLLSELAVMTGLLTMEQTMFVLDTQLSEPGKDFVTIAQEQALLTHGELAWLAQQQYKKRPRLGELLIREKYVSRLVVRHELERYAELRRQASEASAQNPTSS